MARLQHIVIVTGNYPTPAHPNQGTFVRQLVSAIARRGTKCTVIHPWKLHEWLRERKQDSRGPTEAANDVKIYRPVMVSVSNRRFGPLNTFALTHANFQQAVWRVLSRLPEKPDAIYGHFLYSAGATAVWAGTRLGRPCFVAVGESTGGGKRGLWSLQNVGTDVAKRLFARATGFIAVSNLLRQQLTSELSIPESKIGVFPNGIDPLQFHPRNRQAMRRKHALPEDRFLVVFVGSFDERKGIQRVCRAMEGLPQVSGIFVGDGPLRPGGDQISFCGRASHEEVPELLCAADAFVLPSREEGCSNATLEAMACKLPVVVSNRSFNADVCDKESAWLVDPDDIGAIREAIVGLQMNPDLRRRFADAAFSRTVRFDIADRARRIIEWMEAKIAGEQPALSESAGSMQKIRRG